MIEIISYILTDLSGFLSTIVNIAVTQRSRIKYRTVMSRTTRAHLKEEGRWFDEGSN